MRKKIKFFDTGIKYRSILVLGDTHCPALNKDALKWATSIEDTFQCTKVIQVGDIIDARAWSRFPLHPDFENPQLEWEQAVESINYVHDLFPNLTIIEGNHCIEKSTEVLTSDGWVTASDITIDHCIASVNLATNEVTYSKPIDLWSFVEQGAIKAESNFSEELVSKNHSFVYRNKKVKYTEVKDEDVRLPDLTYGGVRNTTLVNEEDTWLRLITWVVCDGTIRRDEGVKARVQFKLSKERKISALTTLLDEIGIKYSVKKATMSGCNKLQPYMIRFYGDYAREVLTYLSDSKKFPPHWKNLNTHQLRVVLDTLLITDGSRHFNKISWSTTEQSDVDVISIACANNNVAFKFSIKEHASGFANAKPLYICSVADNGVWVGNKVSYTQIQGTFTFVGITTVDGTLITRRNGKTVVTGNCNRIMKKAFEVGIPRSLIKGLEEVFAFDGWDWHFGNSPLVVDNIAFIHGDEMTGSVGAKAAALGMNLVQGHSHQCRLEYRPMFNKTIWGVEAGCLVDPDSSAFRYAAKSPRKQWIGVVVILDGVPVPIPYPGEGNW